jgi:hypothetical protein
MISTQVQQSLESLDPLVVTGLYEHSSFPMSISSKKETNAYNHSSLSLSSSLKNETNSPPFKSSLTLERMYLNLLFLQLVKIFLLVVRRLNEERIRFDGGNDAWEAGLHPLEIMLERSH